MPVRILLAFAALALAGPTIDRPPVDADPPLWVARDADTVLYLFGSVHWLPDDIGWFDDAVRDTFDASDTLVLESIAAARDKDDAEIRSVGTLTDGPPLPDRLPPPDRVRLAAALDKVGYPAGAFDRTKPWLAATSLSVLPLTSAGYSAEFGVEAVLTAEARRVDKPVVALEGRRTQLGYFDTLPETDQIAMLVRVLDGIDAVVDSNERTLAAWSAGDVAALRAITLDDLRQSPRAFSDVIVDDRNARWTRWLASRIERPGTVFVAVGSAHLVGPGNLLERLGARGIRVRRVRY